MNILPASPNGKITLLSSILQALVITVLEIVVFQLFLSSGVDTQSQGPARGIPVYLIVFILAQLFQIIMAWDALINENTIQLLGFAAFNICIFCYSIFQYSQLINVVAAQDRTTVLSGCLIAIPVVTGLFSALVCFQCYKLYQEYGWKVYKRIGADPHMRDMYRTYQIFVMLVKLDVFFTTGFGIQFLVLVLNSTSDPEYGLTIAAIPLMLMVLAIAVYGIRQENRVIGISFLVGLVCAVAYFIFKIFRIYTQTARYADTKNFLTFFAALSLLVVISSFVITVLCIMNFEKGLKAHLNKGTAIPVPLQRRESFDPQSSPMDI